MDARAALQLLQAMIDYFEAGNQESDAVAKAILASDFAATGKWRGLVKELQEGAEWTGLRAPEAEIMVAALRRLQELAGAGETG